MLDPAMIEKVRAAIGVKSIHKVAFTPLTPEAQQAAMQQQAVGGPAPGGGAPMPAGQAAAMGGMPPPPTGMDPAGGAGGPPPGAGSPPPGAGSPPPGMDPSAGAPPGMDPAGGMPPGGDPSQGMPPAGVPGSDPSQAPQPVIVNLQDLQTMFGQQQNQGGPTNADVMNAVGAIAEQMQAMTQAMGLQLPAAQTGSGADAGIPQPSEPAALDAMVNTPPPPAGAPKQASMRNHSPLLATVQRLQKYR